MRFRNNMKTCWRKSRQEKICIPMRYVVLFLPRRKESNRRSSFFLDVCLDVKQIWESQASRDFNSLFLFSSKFVPINSQKSGFDEIIKFDFYVGDRLGRNTTYDWKIRIISQVVKLFCFICLSLNFKTFFVPHLAAERGPESLKTFQ